MKPKSTIYRAGSALDRRKRKRCAGYEVWDLKRRDNERIFNWVVKSDNFKEMLHQVAIMAPYYRPNMAPSEATN